MIPSRAARADGKIAKNRRSEDPKIRSKTVTLRLQGRASRGLQPVSGSIQSVQVSEWSFEQRRVASG